jgi:hypothetical protein
VKLIIGFVFEGVSVWVGLMSQYILVQYLRMDGALVNNLIWLAAWRAPVRS